MAKIKPTTIVVQNVENGDYIKICTTRPPSVIDLKNNDVWSDLFSVISNQLNSEQMLLGDFIETLKQNYVLIKK